ncbi:MBL fold metallo-hydrolase [Planococcus lenghuensis]|uniref:Metallo-beta-lactamase domain-containing protein n=1 Tax=Planococcus lenghuensis TaxID=2213202 RepID=A0A1Q2KZ26_9BACL|nr:MBL fold metallo-hydrolase [Planococcus lenghuensis]AQQ53460.1 hypothetical protein B0X71_10500 [Planococcus lenghuensis]
MPAFICITCGTQYAPSAQPPAHCRICEEERQYVNIDGQQWATLDELRESGRYSNRIEQISERIYSITTAPKFAIGQTAYFIKGQKVNLLWDAVTFLDEETSRFFEQQGGIDAIALSHPHYYCAVAEWSEEFKADVYIHEADAEWIVNPGSRFELWSGKSLQLSEEFTLHQLGGHFAGAAIAHADIGKGIVFSGDVIQVASDRNWTSFMYSYPNMIPLPIPVIKRMKQDISRLVFDELYNAFDRKVAPDAKEKVLKSADRYIQALNGELFDT